MADATNTGIISGAMKAPTDPNAPTDSTDSNTNPATATSAPSSTPTPGSNISSGPNVGSPSDFMSQLSSSSSAASPSSAPSSKTPSAAATPSTSNAPATDNNSQLAQLYQSDFGRAPDAAGEAFWSQQLNNGATTADVNKAFLASPEYAALHSSSGIPASGIQTKASTYAASKLGDPTQLNVGTAQTVQGQLANIMDPNSPIIMQARTAGLQSANQSGLLNSSIATGAAQDSAYKAALPIAEQDATTYNNDAATNAAAANAFAVDNQASENAAGQFNANGQNTLTGQQLSNQTALTNAQTAADTSIKTNAASNATSIANTNSNNATSIANTTANNATSSSNNAANNATSVANTATTTASQQAIAQLNNANTTAIQSASNTQQAAAQYQTALTNISNMNMDATSKYNADLNAFNAYKNAISLMDQKLGVPDLSGQLQFNEVNPAASAGASSANSGANNP